MSHYGVGAAGKLMPNRLIMVTLSKGQADCNRYGNVALVHMNNKLTQLSLPDDEGSKYNNANKPPEEFNTDIMSISSTRKMCAVKLDGSFGCWNSNNNNTQQITQ